MKVDKQLLNNAVAEIDQLRARVASLESALTGCVTSMDAIKKYHDDAFIDRDNQRLEAAKSLLK